MALHSVASLNNDFVTYKTQKFLDIRTVGVALKGLLKNVIPGSCNTGSKSRLLKNTIPEHLTGVKEYTIPNFPEESDPTLNYKSSKVSITQLLQA